MEPTRPSDKFDDHRTPGIIFPSHEPLLGTAYPEGHWPDDEPEETCSGCGEDIDDLGTCGCDDEPWHDEEKM